MRREELGSREGPKPWERITQGEVLTTLRVLKAYAGHPRFDLTAIGRNMQDLEEVLPEAIPSKNSHALLGRLPSFSRENPQAFEEEHILGAESSLPSSSNWRVFHPEYDPSISFRPINSLGHRLMKVRKGAARFGSYWMGVPTIHLARSNQETNIEPKIYIDTKGKRRVVLTIWNAKQNGRTIHGQEGIVDGTRLQRCLLRDETTDGIDGSVVVFARGEEKHDINIKVSQDVNELVITEMEPVSAASEA